jgi:hypothetical protein
MQGVVLSISEMLSICKTLHSYPSFSLFSVQLLTYLQLYSRLVKIVLRVQKHDILTI